MLVPVSEAKGRLSELLREADEHDVVLTRHGRAAAVLNSYARHEALVDRLEDALDRLSVYERDSMIVDFEKLVTSLGLDEE